jgi:hypothetical protein
MSMSALAQKYAQVEDFAPRPAATNGKAGRSHCR